MKTRVQTSEGERLRRTTSPLRVWHIVALVAVALAILLALYFSLTPYLYDDTVAEHDAPAFERPAPPSLVTSVG